MNGFALSYLLFPSLANIISILNLKLAICENGSIKMEPKSAVWECTPRQNNVNLVALSFDDCALYLGIACTLNSEYIRYLGSDAHT